MKAPISKTEETKRGLSAPLFFSTMKNKAVIR
jgi:hypothetical protein